ncbi:MAG: ABC transporter permease [Ginsengibacter sp.]
MIKNYIKMAWRSLIKNKVSSFINIGGLSIGLATAIIIMLVIVNEVSYDTFNKNLADIRLLMKNQNMNGDIITGRQTPGPLAASVRAEIPEVKFAARSSQVSSELLRSGDKSIYLDGIYADPDFFKMMSFPALEGNPVTVLNEPGSIVITQSTAKKLFGDEDAMGKMIVHNNLHALKVAAVIRDVPANSTNKFEIVLPFRLLEKENDWVAKWDNNRIQTWVQVQPNTNTVAFNKKLTRLFVEKQDEKNMALFGYPFSDLRLFGNFKNGKPNGGIIYIIAMLSLVGLFVLLIACVNFMNLATARSEQRAREVGVRKVMGASRKLLIFQFMSEAILMSFLALLIGVGLSYIALPGFMQVSGNHFIPDYFNLKIWSLLIALGLITGVIAGSYPALYLSRFQLVKVLKGIVVKGKRSGMLRRGLVTFQFIISIFLIVATIVFFKQVDHMERRPIGYNADNLIEIPARGDMADKFSIVKNELLQIPGVKNVSAGNDDLIRFGGAFNGLEWPGKTDDQDFYITSTSVQYDWIKTAGLTLTAGRDFSSEYGADSMSCLINEAAARRMRLKEPITGTKLGNNTVIGVVKDFVYNNSSSDVQPMIIYLNTGSLSHFFVRIANNDRWKDCVAKIEAAVKKINPNIPFDFHFTKEEYQANLRQIRSVGQMANMFGGMAIVISCLGLFGLSIFLAERRSKELSVRKVLGASVKSIWFTLSKDFLKPVFIAFIIAAPLAGLVLQKALSLMDYHIQLAWWMFASAEVLAILIALITVSFNGIKAALENPIKSLRSE